MSNTTITAEPGKQEIFVTRIIDAPREKVWQACTDPTMIPKWWGPRGLTTTIYAFELKHGGVWRFVQKDDNGAEFAFRGVYHHIEPMTRVIQTFEWEGMPGHVLMETVVFEDMPDGKTKITEQSVFQSVADRDGMLQSGMEHGANESTERLQELLS